MGPHQHTITIAPGTPLMVDCPRCHRSVSTSPCPHCGARYTAHVPTPSVRGARETCPDAGSRTLGGYRVAGVRCRGGMGVILDGVRIADGRPVVLKAPVGADPDSRLRFTREAQALASLEHPNVMRMLDIDATEDGLPLLVLERIDGPNLREVLQRGTPPIAVTERIAADLARALDHCHRRGVVHRDVKPENIVVHAEGCVLLDFGLALVDVDRECGRFRGALTPVGSLIGTPPYAAPEQLGDASGIDGRADCFGLGRVLLECLGDAARDARTERWRSLGNALCRVDPALRPSPAAVLDLVATTTRPASGPRPVQAPVRSAAAGLLAGVLCAAALLAAIVAWPRDTPTTRLEGVVGDGESDAITLDLADDEHLVVETVGDTLLRLPGGGAWSAGPLHLRGNDRGYVVLRVRDGDGRWQLRLRER